MKKINSYFYTKGKFGKRLRETLDTENEYLYAQGRYPTKIKKEDLSEDYIEFKSRSIWYMTGYLKTSGIIDIDYKAIKINHLFKDDYLYISYNEKLKVEKNWLNLNDIVNYDLCVCGNDIIPILLAIKKYSNINIDNVKRKIYDKVDWYKENYREDYIRQFGNEDIDVFEYYEGIRNSKTYFISDTHFNHKNIIKYCNRPFKDIGEMNKTLIENWNNIVTDFDTVFHLGDVALTKEKEMKELIPKLNGKKILLKGNHDTKSKMFFVDAGFWVVVDSPLKLNNEKLILSHKPLKDTEIPEGYINVHGHIHNNPLHKINPETNEMEYPEELYSDKLHINVSTDVIDFKPISLEEMRKRYELKYKE